MRTMRKPALALRIAQYEAQIRELEKQHPPKMRQLVRLRRLEKVLYEQAALQQQAVISQCDGVSPRSAKLMPPD